jgi:putative hemolysin
MPTTMTDLGPAFTPRWTASAPSRPIDWLASITESRYHVELAESIHDVREAQRLRYEVFSSEFGACFPSGSCGLDEDEFDRFCDHIIVRSSMSSQVVGTYRVLLPRQAKAVGRYYSQSEFFMTRIQRQIPDLVELGRSCVHPDHRSGPVIMMLWSAIARYMRMHGCHHLMGCASVSMRDGGVSAATLWDRFSRECMVDPLLEAFPKNSLPLEEISRASDAIEPPLIRAYLRLGAQICGQPSWDPDFNTADFLMLMDMRKMSPRFARHFGLSSQVKE